MDRPDLPLVSVICLCYNHSKYVIESIESVLSQSYENIELIVVDDASNDGSQAVIRGFLENKPQVSFISLTKNTGNCRAFNIGWQASSGNYIIDLAADDLLLPDSVSIGVGCFLKRDSNYGVHFGDAHIINAEGDLIEKHLTGSYFKNGVPEGLLFDVILEKYFINPATMMYSKQLLEYLGGYDESLAYEDFDLWVRSSKKFNYCYSEEPLIAKRVLKNSHGARQYKPKSKMLKSTFVVCQKAYALCEEEHEFRALLIRIKYEMKMAFFSLNWSVVPSFYRLRLQTLEKLNAPES